jgi:hypothetical protein
LRSARLIDTFTKSCKIAKKDIQKKFFLKGAKEKLQGREWQKLMTARGGLDCQSNKGRNLYL